MNEVDILTKGRAKQHYGIDFNASHVDNRRTGESHVEWLYFWATPPTQDELKIIKQEAKAANKRGETLVKVQDGARAPTEEQWQAMEAHAAKVDAAEKELKSMQRTKDKNTILALAHLLGARDDANERERVAADMKRRAEMLEIINE